MSLFLTLQLCLSNFFLYEFDTYLKLVYQIENATLKFRETNIYKKRLQLHLSTASNVDTLWLLKTNKIKTYYSFLSRQYVQKYYISNKTI